MNNHCPKCDAVYSVSEQHIGRRIACKKCGVSLAVSALGLQIADALSASQVALPAAELSLPLQPPIPYSKPEEPRPPSVLGRWFWDFVTFRVMIVPFAIQLLFWLGVLFCVVYGIVFTIQSISGKAWFSAIFGVVSVILGPFFFRVVCENMLVLFRIHEVLIDIRADLRRSHAIQLQEKKPSE